MLVGFVIPLWRFYSKTIISRKKDIYIYEDVFSVT